MRLVGTGAEPLGGELAGRVGDRDDLRARVGAAGDYHREARFRHARLGQHLALHQRLAPLRGRREAERQHRAEPACSPMLPIQCPLSLP